MEERLMMQIIIKLGYEYLQYIKYLAGSPTTIHQQYKYCCLSIYSP